MPAWRARSVNTLVAYERGPGNHPATLDEWLAAARRHQLFTIRHPHDDLAADAADPYLLALMQPDEPDQHDVDPALLADQYTAWKKQLPTTPVFLNVSGGHVLFRKTPREVYRQYFAAADWIGNDFYPITGWNQPTWLPRVGQIVDLCRDLSEDKPQFAFIETSSQQLAWLPKDSRGPTSDEVRAQIWDAVIHRVKGIVYFPQQFNPFSYDATPSNVSVELAKQNRLLENLGPILPLPPKPKTASVAVPTPTEAAWRVEPDGTGTLIVLNLSPTKLSSQQITLSGFHVNYAKMPSDDDRELFISEQGFRDDFGPYQVHVYKMGWR
jgi:hypothetical protein